MKEKSNYKNLIFYWDYEIIITAQSTKVLSINPVAIAKKKKKKKKKKKLTEQKQKQTKKSISLEMNHKLSLVSKTRQNE